MKTKNTTLNMLTGLLVLAVIYGCGSSGNTSGNGIPAWVNDPGTAFSQDQYLMAVGSGSTLNEATSDAFASLSQIFKMNVDASEEVYSETIEGNVGSKTFSDNTLKLLNNIRIGTNQQLMNTSILISDVDNFGTYYALAGMNRSESSRIYNQEIASNRFKIEDFESIAENEPNVLQKLVLLKKAKSLAAANEILTSQLNIISRGGASVDLAAQTHNRIEEKYRAAQQRANVIIRTNTATETVRSAVTAVLQKSGFNVTDNTENALLSVNVNYQTQPANLNRDDADFVKWELMIEVEDLQSNRSFKTYTTEGRDGAPSYEDALKRADFTARNKIEKDFNRFLNNELLATY